MKQIRQTTIYNNYDTCEAYEAAKQYLMEEVLDSEDEPSDADIWDQVHLDDNLNWDIAWDELERFFKNRKVIFFGNVGRWNGTFAGGKIGTFEKLFYDAVEDCDYVNIYDQDGHLYLECSHHDGTNNFEIKLLTDKGYNYSENWSYTYSKKYDYNEQEMHRRIVDCSFLSVLPHFARTVYGY